MFLFRPDLWPLSVISLQVAPKFTQRALIWRRTKGHTQVRKSFLQYNFLYNLRPLKFWTHDLEVCVQPSTNCVLPCNDILFQSFCLESLTNLGIQTSHNVTSVTINLWVQVASSYLFVFCIFCQIASFDTPSNYNRNEHKEIEKQCSNNISLQEFLFSSAMFLRAHTCPLSLARERTKEGQRRGGWRKEG